MMLANLLHLSYNMWCDRNYPGASPHIVAQPYLRFDETLWRDVLTAMAEAGMNALVLDLGDGVRWDSHPEIAVENAWTPAKLREELDRARELGIEPLPKLNFSTAHDAWLGPYSRMVSTPQYYEVCRDLIDEASELFGRPRLFHLGMDEERAEYQRHYAYAVMRQHELWWHDLGMLIEAVESTGARAWVWSDQGWSAPEEFCARMPHRVVQSNWYYDTTFGEDEVAPQFYGELAAHGYDQIPTGSNWSSPENFERTVEYCIERVPADKLLGFLMAPWHPTLEEYRQHHLSAVSQVKAARRLFERAAG